MGKLDGGTSTALNLSEHGLEEEQMLRSVWFRSEFSNLYLRISNACRNSKIKCR